MLLSNFTYNDPCNFPLPLYEEKKNLKYNVKAKMQRKIKHKLQLEKCALQQITGKRSGFSSLGIKSDSNCC